MDITADISWLFCCCSFGASRNLSEEWTDERLMCRLATVLEWNILAEKSCSQQHAALCSACFHDKVSGCVHVYWYPGCWFTQSTTSLCTGPKILNDFITREGHRFLHVSDHCMFPTFSELYWLCFYSLSHPCPPLSISFSSSSMYVDDCVVGAISG